MRIDRGGGVTRMPPGMPSAECRVPNGRRCLCSEFGTRNSALGILMSLRIYNTLTRTKDLFEPVTPGKVGMYLCGPTVYKSPHIGHMVGPVIFDVVKRYLQFKGFEVTWVVNITDVDDKLIDAANKLNTTVDELATKHTREYFEALAALGVSSID